MSSFTLSKVSAVQSRATGYGQFKRRWLHGSLKRQAIMMPAMSPLMMTGTITRWKKREGEAFAVGDVLLQIESDTATIDVEACSPGILGRILMPDGSENVPIEQVIALVARDMNELALLQNQPTVPAPPPYNPIPTPPSTSPAHFDQFKSLSSPRTPVFSPRTPSLFEKQKMGYGHRSVHVGGPHGRPKLSLANFDNNTPSIEEQPSPSPLVSSRQSSAQTPQPLTPRTAKWPNSAVDVTSIDQAQVEGAAIRRMIVSNLASKQGNATDELF
ncbi:single hybrid motif-containing protein [Pholiota conissans]|uniref:Single hybrid motif-containing protein n=1 Tax=Pholiota conissans TaxID=109636 RepID=A0A9P5ZE04_9AGAR|nr:single hybrid motif-containing protein [Pholiota conissans]